MKWKWKKRGKKRRRRRWEDPCIVCAIVHKIQSNGTRRAPIGTDETENIIKFLSSSENRLFRNWNRWEKGLANRQSHNFYYVNSFLPSISRNNGRDLNTKLNCVHLQRMKMEMRQCRTRTQRTYARLISRKTQHEVDRLQFTHLLSYFQRQNHSRSLVWPHQMPQ